ncbi:MAG: methionyl-tRNA formyltransferase [Rhodospirillaceae bacterium]|nr:methionyl-tRNA formyltransferase [Rhodospirillaceae bacterium]
MNSNGILFLAAFTNRSRAYAQALAAAGLSPEKVILFGSPPAAKPADQGPDKGVEEIEGLFIPDLGEPLEETVARAGWDVQHCPAKDVNDPALSRLLLDLQPRLVIYSGYGGQLVGAAVLDLGFDFLHLHCGWLPDYRGSTTVYYSWLKEGRCGVSALILEKEIDSGPIVARRRYPLPPRGMDVDSYYDNMLRAALLVNVLKDFTADGTLPRIPNEDGGLTYYVIHPVLKHIALLSLEANG